MVDVIMGAACTEMLVLVERNFPFFLFRNFKASTRVSKWRIAVAESRVFLSSKWSGRGSLSDMINARI